MAHWAEDAVFYHLYPLGFCGAPRGNDLCSASVPRLEKVVAWIPHLRELGVDALYLGPLFESTAHGYDTADYWHVDRRLGSDDTLRALSASLHAAGIRLILDGVFNHVGRDFWAFRDLREHGASSRYASWFSGLRFDRRSPRSDPFGYDTWNGAADLVKLNLKSDEVREHLLGAVQSWIERFGIDGLRLDVADCLDLDFQRALAARCRSSAKDFFLLGEVVHGDYRRWANAQVLDSVTNYECYKGLWSSHADRNCFEIAYALNRQFGEGGLYRGLPLYNFADNHDVDRVASRLKERAHLHTLYALLFAMPGVPSIYYGSEWGLAGQRTRDDDSMLRPCLELEAMCKAGDHALLETIRRLAAIRHRSPALRHGDYLQLLVAHEQLAFARRVSEEQMVFALNAAAEAVTVELDLRAVATVGTLVDVLNHDERFELREGRARLQLPSHSARFLKMQM